MKPRKSKESRLYFSMAYKAGEPAPVGFAALSSQLRLQPGTPEKPISEQQQFSS